MQHLEQYTIFHDHQTGEWVLKRDDATRALKCFSGKAEAIAYLPTHFGDGSPASVKIKKLDGTIEEERTYPRSMDPTKSPG